MLNQSFLSSAKTTIEQFVARIGLRSTQFHGDEEKKKNSSVHWFNFTFAERKLFVSDFDDALDPREEKVDE